MVTTSAPMVRRQRLHDEREDGTQASPFPWLQACLCASILLGNGFSQQIIFPMCSFVASNNASVGVAQLRAHSLVAWGVVQGY